MKFRTFKIETLSIKNYYTRIQRFKNYIISNMTYYEQQKRKPTSIFIQSI